MEEIKAKYICTKDGDDSSIDIYEVNGHIVIVATPTIGRDGISVTTIN